jgi:hypothetical protein
MINAVELKRIADFLGVKMENLTKLRENEANTTGTVDNDVILAFMGKVESRQAKNALEIADRLSDMILFHSRVRENGVEMMEAWDC